MLTEFFESPQRIRNYATARMAACLKGLLTRCVRRATRR